VATPGPLPCHTTYMDEDVPFENIVEFYRCCREMGGRGVKAGECEGVQWQACRCKSVEGL